MYSPSPVAMTTGLSSSLVVTLSRMGQTLEVAVLSSTGRGSGEDVGAHRKEGALGNYGVVDAIDGSGNSRDGECFSGDLTKGWEDHRIDHIGGKISGTPGVGFAEWGE